MARSHVWGPAPALKEVCVSDIGTERREVEFEPFPDQAAPEPAGVPEPEPAPTEPAPA